MPDELDHLQENNSFDKQVEANIAKARAEAKAAPVLARKFCLNCNERTKDGAAFCDTDCQEDYEKIQRMRGFKR